MEHLSIILWEKLNRLIGIEEQVYIRRTFRKTCEETLANIWDENVTWIDSGSRAEGLRLPGSDYDEMFILNAVSVLPTEYGIQCPDFIMETTNIKPGFAKLRFTGNVDISHKFQCESMIKFNNSLYLSSLLFRDEVVTELKKERPGFFPHGPCATNTYRDKVEIDNVFCFSCKVWPAEASEWIHRYRPSQWPSRELIQRIVDDGFLLVPIGNLQSPASYMEWRMSFSLAEKNLVYSFNHTQFLCYGLLKLYLKHVIESNKEVKGLLCSYFLKTCLFYCIEEEHIAWDKNNLTECFMVCLRRLTSWVKDGYCPNYFITHNNMFEGKIFGAKRKRMEKYLSELCEDGILTVIGIPCFSDLDSRIKLILQTPTFAFSELVISRTEKEFRCDKEIFTIFFEDCIEDTETVMKGKSSLQNLSTQTASGSLKHMYINILKDMFDTALTHCIYLPIFNKQRSNKSQYRLLNMFKNHIIQDCTHGDICTGWLQYATFCYITGQYSKVVLIIEYILGKFKNYTIHYGHGVAKYCGEEYVKKMCDKGFSVHQKMKRALAHSYNCMPELGFYPSEIACEINHHSLNGFVSIPPIVYSNVLLFLSYKRLGCKELRDDTLHELYVCTEDEQFLGELERPISSALLAKCATLV